MVSEEVAKKSLSAIIDSAERLGNLKVEHPADIVASLLDGYIEMMQTVCYILENEAPSDKLREMVRLFSFDVEFIHFCAANELNEAKKRFSDDQ